MSQNKWEKIRQKHHKSRIHPQISEESSEIAQDFIRSLFGRDAATGEKLSHVYLEQDGKTIQISANKDMSYTKAGQDILNKYFLDKEGHPSLDVVKAKLETFMKNELLKDYKGDKEACVSYIRKTLHQGGLFNPASGALAGELTRHGYTPTTMKKVKFIPTETGFKVQEICEAISLQSLRGAANVEKGKDEPYLIQAQCILDIDFTSPMLPHVRVESNSIAYNNQELYQELRSWKEILLEWLIEKYNNAVITLNERFGLDIEQIDTKVEFSDISEIESSEKVDKGNDQENDHESSSGLKP